VEEQIPVEERREQSEEDITLSELKAINIAQMAGIAGKVIDYALSKIVDVMLTTEPIATMLRQTGRTGLEGVLSVLEENIDLLSFDLLDEAMMNVPSRTIKMMINMAIKAGSAFVKGSEFGQALKDDPTILIDLLQKVRPDVAALLNRFPKLKNFIASYVAYKLLS